MERRGFIEKFAKAAAGVFLSPEELYGDNEPDRKYRQALPRIIKVTDETLQGKEGIDRVVLLKMLKSGLDSVFPDIAEKDFIKIIFPGLVAGAKVGICWYVSAGAGEASVTTPLSTAEVLCSYPAGMVSLQNNIDIWIPGSVKVKHGAGTECELKTKSLKDFPIDEKIDLPLVLEDQTIIPCPALSRVYQFQIGLFSSDGQEKIINPCRDLYLNCFINEKNSRWLCNLSEGEKWSLFERIQYPQGMKFRMYIADYTLKDGAIYLCNDGVLLDKLLNGENDEAIFDRIDLVEVINPSAPVIEGIKRFRKGDDIIIEWSDEIESGRFQIYRSESDDFRPAKKYLIGITGERLFKDEGAAKTGQFNYMVTGAWSS